jgi:hypothetical protein
VAAWSEPPGSARDEANGAAQGPGCMTLGNEGVDMLIAKSKVTRQGPISVPVEVRRDLGIRTGSELIWERQEI